MAEKRDYYEILGVGNNATADEIKKAYRQKARKLHPDVNRDDPHAEEHFKELGEAYDALSDEQKRAVYDRFGHAGLQGGMGNAGGGFNGSPFGGFGDISDIFETFFNGGTSSSRPDPRGNDLRYDLEISLEEAAFGAERTIHIPHQMPCTQCHGRGTEEGNVVACPACAGMGATAASGQ